jgi:hypothetical protein
MIASTALSMVVMPAPLPSSGPGHGGKEADLDRLAWAKRVLEMKMLRRRAHQRCLTKRHDVKWPRISLPIICPVPVVTVSARCIFFGLRAEICLGESNLSLMRAPCPEFLLTRTPVRHALSAAQPSLHRRAGNQSRKSGVLVLYACGKWERSHA